MRFVKQVAIAVLLASSLPVFADEVSPSGRFFDRKGEGWYWYHDPKEKVQIEPKSTPKAAPKPAPEPKDEPFSVEWLRKNMPILMDRAINDPTKENVEAYLYAQRVAMDKSQRYAEMTQKVVAADPFLDENNRVPLATYAKPFFLRKADEGKEEALKHLSTVAGIWVFFDSKCEFCRPQANTAVEMAKRYGIHTKFISMDGKGLPNIQTFVKNEGHAQTLGLTITPTTVLIVPPNSYYIVSQGMMAQDQLADRILLAAESNNLLPSDLAAKVRAYDRGVLTNNDTKSGATDDPKDWVKTLKDRLKGRY
ncbi:conjugal transfer protein TraF [Noviherbaspirillum sp. CPCC 100848]|uniref:Conjugal transfer protein TraF n=1 Tax=Noviherbaspirillum album TaxID=3080276 RepID=A0ABU6JAM2_9BURK|nr:conjugal transfer protein TraF [Noviherbaspirillum sp. CPCC 100848]